MDHVDRLIAKLEYSIIEAGDCDVTRAENLVGERATITGISVTDRGDVVAYCVVFDGHDETMMLPVHAVYFTGEKRDPAEFESGDSIRVRPDGTIVDSPD
jgi:hypothetical protein